MRKEIVAQRSLLDQAIDLLISVFKPNKTLKKMDTIIDANPDIVRAVHADLTKGLQNSGRPGYQCRASSALGRFEAVEGLFVLRVA